MTFLQDWLPIAISMSALLVAMYGLWERNNVLRRAERVRLSEIITDVNGLGLELLKLPSELQQAGPAIQTINTHAELLGQQAMALLGNFTGTITSTEYRTLAYWLSNAGYQSDADQVWRWAVEQANKEGSTQSVFALRAYGTFLFQNGNPGQARIEYEQAVQRNSNLDASYSWMQAETLLFWANNEASVAAHEGRAYDLLDRADGTLLTLPQFDSRRLQLTESISRLRHVVAQRANGT
jgi:hypothetical protein